MGKKNIIIVSIAGIAVIIVLLLLFVVKPFDTVPPPVQTEISEQAAPDSLNQQVAQKPEDVKPQPDKKKVPAKSDISNAEEDYDTYIVKEGETLQSIAERLYGDRKKWFKIFAANESKIDWYDTIYVGQKLIIPAP